LPSRALALFLDLGLMGITLFVVAVLALLAASNTDDALGAAIFLVSVIAVVIGYPVAFETLSRGRSPGKAALGLRVVRDDGGPVRFRHALTRALIGVLVDFNPLLIGAIGVLTSLASSKGKRVGDMLAGTVVLRERVPATKTPPALMPPHLAQWAAGLPVTRLPDALALEARQVLGRLDELEPEIGEALSRQLADEILVSLGVSAPGGSDPIALLSAVLAERRNRELARAGFPPGPWGPPPGSPPPGSFPAVAPGGGPPPAATWGQPPPPRSTWGQPPPPQPTWGQPPPPQPTWGQPPPPQPTWGQPPAPTWSQPPAQPAWEQQPAQPAWDQPPAQPTWDQPPPPEPEPPSAGPFAAPG
jgi:uncharacterized RDD family membrane protein YckC